MPASCVARARSEARCLALLIDEMADRLLAAPLQRVDAGVDHAAIGAEQLELEIAKPSQGIVVVHPDLIRELFGVQRPAFAIAGKSTGLADERQRRVGESEPSFHLMTGQTFVIDGRGETEFWPFRAVVQIEINQPWAGSVDRR